MMLMIWRIISRRIVLCIVCPIPAMTMFMLVNRCVELLYFGKVDRSLMLLKRRDTDSLWFSCPVLGYIRIVV